MKRTIHLRFTRETKVKMKKEFERKTAYREREKEQHCTIISQNNNLKSML